MVKYKIQKLLEKILLENKADKYCSNCDGRYSINIEYKNCSIHISHNPVTEIKKQRNFFFTEEIEVATGNSNTHVHIHPNDRNTNSSYFRFTDGEILPYLVRYVERYEERELNKKNKFLKSLLDE